MLDRPKERLTVPCKTVHVGVYETSRSDIGELSRPRGFIFVMAPIYPLMTSEGATDTARPWELRCLSRTVSDCTRNDTVVNLRAASTGVHRTRISCDRRQSARYGCTRVLAAFLSRARRINWRLSGRPERLMELRLIVLVLAFHRARKATVEGGYRLIMTRGTRKSPRSVFVVS